MSHLHWFSACWILLTSSEICVTMGIRAFISIFAYSTFLKMSALDCLKVCSWNWIWNIVKVLLLMLLWFIIVAILLHSTLHILRPGLTIKASTILLETSSSTSTHRSTEFLVHTVIDEISTHATSHTGTWAARTAYFLLHSFSGSLVTVLVLNAFQSKS